MQYSLKTSEEYLKVHKQYTHFVYYYLFDVILYMLSKPLDIYIWVLRGKYVQRQSHRENLKGWIRVHACTCALNLEAYTFIYLMMVGEND